MTSDVESRRNQEAPPYAARVGLVFYVDEFGVPRSTRSTPVPGSTIEEIFDSDPLDELALDVDDVAQGERDECSYAVNYCRLTVTAGGYQLTVQWPGSQPFTEASGPVDDLRGLLAEWNDYCTRHPAP